MSSITSEQFQNDLTVQENALASSMIHAVGDMTLRYVVLQNGNRQHQVSSVSRGEWDDLTTEFADDPKTSLAWARQSLCAIASDTRSYPDSRSRRLNRYMDAYTSLTMKLDHAAFPPTAPGEVRRGVPDYLPDGFVDLGGERSVNPQDRSREMIKVDKQAIFDKYRPTLKAIFERDYSNVSGDRKKQIMFETIAQAVYFGMPYDHSGKNLGSNTVQLSQLSEGVCRHQAMTFQVLAQAAGLTSRLLKSHLEIDGKQLGRHASNLIRINHQWYVFDATNPDYILKPDGNNVWRPGIVPVDQPPRQGEHNTYQGKQKYSGREFTWTAHDNMFWYIDQPS